MTDPNHVFLFDSTLRDGAQTLGVDFTVEDKRAIAVGLDQIGIDYVEAGWPGSNPTDDALFASPPPLKRAKMTAFGMTRRSGRSAANDPGLAALLQTGAEAICLVGKTWDFQAEIALGVSLDENLKMIEESIAHLVAHGREAIFDAEHFFDGYKANPAYAMACLQAAERAGGRWITLCDTNGGSLPHEVEAIVRKVSETISGGKLGIHCHNDTENAVANSLAAIRAGARLLQGTLNGLGERCGNANLISLIPTLLLKMGHSLSVDGDGLKRLTALSRLVDDRLNQPFNPAAAYVGERAFAHKGGLHVSAIQKDPRTYEHIDPALVGNRRHIPISDQSGRANFLARCEELGISIAMDDPRLGTLIELVKTREFEGYAYDGAEASLELLARRTLGTVPDFFRLIRFRVTDDRRLNAKGEMVTESEATISLAVGNEKLMTVAVGNGPINALDSALRKALASLYPELQAVRLSDYKVRILSSQGGTEAVTRVVIESHDDEGQHWRTVGVSANVIDASFEAISDSITWKLLHRGQASGAA